MKKATTYLLAATLICGMGSTASAEETGASVSTFEDASMYVQEVDNTTIQESTMRQLSGIIPLIQLPLYT